MRIAIFCDNFYPELSGISDSIIATAKGLAAHGHEIRFYVPWHPKRNYRKVGHKPRELDLGSSITVKRLPAILMPAPTGQGRFSLPLGTSLRSLRAWHPDIIHTHHFGGAGLEAVIASRLLKVPLIGTNHTPFREFMQYTPIHTAWAVNTMLRYVSWYYNKCVFVTAPSHFLFQEMIDYGFKKPHRSLSNIVHPEEYQPVDDMRKAELRQRFSLHGPTIIYAGRLAPEKHVDVIIQALSTVVQTSPNARLLIVGHGISEKPLKNLAKDLHLEDHVRFLGYVGQETLAEAYQAADIFAVTSTAEMQCLSMMNAMLCELPVIGVRAGALPEYINGANGFVVEPGDHQDLAQKILFLINNPEEAKLLGHQGRSFAEQFSSPNITEEWLTIYKRHSAVGVAL